MIEQAMAKGLETGDLIVVAQQNYLFPAIYLDDKGMGNPRFVELNRNIEWMKKHLEKKGKLYKGYVVRPGKFVIARLSERVLDDDTHLKYKEMSDLLKQYKIIPDV